MNKLPNFCLRLALILILFFCFCKNEDFVNLDSTENDFSEFDEFEDQQIGYENLLDPELDIQKDTEPIQLNKDEDIQVLTQNYDRNLDDIVNDNKKNIEELDEFEIKDENLKNTDKKPFQPLTFSNLPLHLRNNWTSFYLEILILISITIYFINFFIGSNTNSKIAGNFWEINHELLKSNFLIVGDDGSDNLQNGFMKDSENLFFLWCTGKVGLECFIIELKLLKRQDLISKVSNWIVPNSDQFVIKIFLNNDSMDTFVFCIANKKSGLKSVKKFNDVFNFCNQRKSIEKLGFLNNYFVVLSELGETINLVLDNFVTDFLVNNFDLINYIHISDQFSGSKPPSDAEITKPPVVRKVLTLSFNFTKNLTTFSNLEETKKFVNFSLYLTDKIRRIKLKKDLKLKASSNRLKVEEHYQKIEHAQRQEAAQAKKEEKRRLEKEKILNENDPYKLRKLEEKEYRKEMKRKAPKMKQVKVKAM